MSAISNVVASGVIRVQFQDPVGLLPDASREVGLLSHSAVQRLAPVGGGQPVVPFGALGFECSRLAGIVDRPPVEVVPHHGDLLLHPEREGGPGRSPQQLEVLRTGGERLLQEGERGGRFSCVVETIGFLEHGRGLLRDGGGRMRGREQTREKERPREPYAPTGGSGSL